MAETSSAATSTAPNLRPPRLPRWTRQEILVLIEGKRVVEKRGRGRSTVTPVEPKWAAISAYCKRHGVNRGPVQCRKRWSNLAGDYKKIKEWERLGDKSESFWGMRNDLRREKRLPGFFDKEVFDIIDSIGTTGTSGPSRGDIEEEEEREEEEEKEREGSEEKVLDSGKKDKPLFEDDEDEILEEKHGEEGGKVETPPVAAVPVSEKSFETPQPDKSQPGTSKEKQQTHNLETDLPSSEGHKRRRTTEDERGEMDQQTQLLELLERNSRLVAAQLEAQNINMQLDRDQRKNQTDSLLGVLNKLADTLGKIADKL